ncbi:Similar to Host cell factor; acc. no. Q9V4C8 [Pyronema omphalodes CBS 100304]|uniref:Similar to Host cell factor acc. no. Q9V4C8 n=1 Tax=Pyronema omphalodes (strain CBS 100304) TaxID=1076935 RepID=U4LAQ3_PYROM|nr:Similar to Host cell factor; acc. no. Q9V4C8 [Pyronema omphalodes CBS 100304]
MAEIKVEKRVERARYKPGRLGKSAEFAKYSRWNIKNTNLKANVWPEDATCTDDCKVSSSAKNRSICNLELASTALLGDRLYINGGIINKKETTNGSPFFKRSTLHRLLWIDLDKIFHWDNPPIGSIEKPKEIRDLFHAGTFVMDADTELLHTFGGYKWADDASMNNTAVVTQGLWLYNATASLTERWVPKIVSTSWNPLPKAGGMQWASDGETGVAYGMGGSENAEIEFRSKDRSWKKMMSTNPRTINTGGFLHHIPVGSRTTGSLILFGGEDRDRRNRGPSKMNSMSNIWIYDTQNDVWHKQTAIGSTELSDIPDERSLGCSVVAPAPDNSSINIYVYGGTSQNYMDFVSMPANASHGMKVALKDDIWVLSIPSFTWTKVHEGSKSLGSFKMSCQRLGRYMVSVGGSHGSYSAGETCKEPINVFDLESLTWNHKKWDSNSDYQVPRVISNVIGGRTAAVLGKA